MNDTWWIIIQAIAQTSVALSIGYITWLIIRGLMLQDHSEGEKHHD
jgi:hypothetical protein